jgi:hydrogenase maturation protease
MDSLGKLLRQLKGRIGLICIGNPDGRDDSIGAKLGQKLANFPNIELAGTEPEECVGRWAEAGYEHLIFVDAVDFGATPGSVVFLGSAEIKSRFPQVSTHHLSLGLLAQLAESNGITKAWLLGVQPETLGTGPELSISVAATLEGLKQVLINRIKAGEDTCPRLSN